MKRTALMVFLGLAFVASTALAGGEIHGTITTVDGDRYTGPIRWDKNENFWDDVIDATKTERVKAEHDHDGLNLRIFGFKITYSGGKTESWTHSQFTIPFGHLVSIEPEGRRIVRLDLKNGESVEVRSSSDIGRSMRGIMIDSEVEGEVDLEWEDIERVEFFQGTGDRDADRLYGTVETTIGEFTGYVVWDKDEALVEDILDGEMDGRDRKIPFKSIQKIEKMGSRGSRVTLNSGKVLELTDSNDVDQDNRGVDVTIADMGRVKLDWKHFERVTFKTPPPSPRYDDFDGGQRLQGTVTTGDGVGWTGEIVWDKDERFTWEAIDGEIKGVEFELTFQYIDRIERASSKSATIRLKDGLEFTLRESNDVNEKNKGIVIRTDAGEEIEVGWDDFESAVFAGG
jgi:hypothetical protein